MKKNKALFFLLAWTALFISSSSYCERELSINVLSYNMQLSGLDEPGHEWDQRKLAIKEFIHRQSPTIGGLQEISGRQLMDLEQAFPQYAFISLNTVNGQPLQPMDPETQEGLSIFYDKAQFQLLQSEHWWLSSTPKVPSRQWRKNSIGWTTSFNKATQKVPLLHQSSGKVLAFFNNHFCHEEHEKINPRRLSAKQELQAFEQLNKDDLIISVGDRNFHFPRGQEVHQMYTSRPYLSDAFKSVQGISTTFMGFQQHPRINQLDEEGQFERQDKLDVIYYSSDKLVLQSSKLYPVEYTEDGHYIDDNTRIYDIHQRRFGSDHAALILKF